MAHGGNIVIYDGWTPMSWSNKRVEQLLMEPSSLTPRENDEDIEQSRPDIDYQRMRDRTTTT